METRSVGTQPMEVELTRAIKLPVSGITSRDKDILKGMKWFAGLSGMAAPANTFARYGLLLSPNGISLGDIEATGRMDDLG